MAKQKTEENKWKLLREKMEHDDELKEMSKRQSDEVLEPVEQPLEREIQLEKDQDALFLYQGWLKTYKKNNPEYQENEDDCKTNPNGNGCILNFNDPKAEEAFVRYIAANVTRGEVIDKGISIAKLEDGKLIDPRTNQEFPVGAYAELVEKLDSGIAYDDIPVPGYTRPTPFSITPY